MVSMTMTSSSANLGDRRRVTLEVTGIHNPSRGRAGSYLITVPYNRLNQTLQSIHRQNGKVINVSLTNAIAPIPPTSLPTSPPSSPEASPEPSPESSSELSPQASQEQVRPPSQPTPSKRQPVQVASASQPARASTKGKPFKPTPSKRKNKG